MYKNQRFWRIFPLSNVQLEWNSAGWTATTMDNLYVYCQLAINRFISREKNFVTHKQQCLQAVDCNDIRFQDGKRFITLGAQSVHTRWILKLKSPCELLHFMRQVTAVACCFCICFAETRIQILSDDVQSVTKISWVNYWVLGGASYFSNILRFWVYLFLENNTICHLRVFGSFVKQNSTPIHICQ